MSLKACAYRKKGMMLLPRGIGRYSVRPWRVRNQDKGLSGTWYKRVTNVEPAY